MGKSRFVFTPLGYFARLYQFLVREPPKDTDIDTMSVFFLFAVSGAEDANIG